MSKKDEIDQAILAAAEKKSPQAKLLRRHFEAISLALEGGMKMAEILQILKEKTGMTFGIRWSYEVIESERKKAKAVPAAKPVKSNPPARSANVMASPVGVPTPTPGSSPASPSVTTPASAITTITPAHPTMDELIAMLPPRPRNGQVEIDHPLPDNLPPGVNIALLKRVMKMDGFNPSWPKDIRLNLLLALPDVLPDHLNPVTEIGGVRCDFRLGMPVEFGSSSDGMGVKRGDDRWDKIISDEKLRRKWRSAHEDIRRAYNDWLKGRIGLPVR